MNILALDTATECCSVAIMTDTGMFTQSRVAPREHGKILLPMLDNLLLEASLQRADIDGIAVDRGPGAFTGVRLGISVAQGLAFALGVPVVTVSSLKALAMAAPQSDTALILSVIDARMGEVYAGVYHHQQSHLVEMRQEKVIDPQRLDLPKAESWHVVGSGWLTYEDVIQAQLGQAPKSAQGACYPQAEQIALLARPYFLDGTTLPPEQALPVYLRDKVAKTLLERGLQPPQA